MAVFKVRNKILVSDPIPMVSKIAHYWDNIPKGSNLKIFRQIRFRLKSCGYNKCEATVFSRST